MRASSKPYARSRADSYPTKGGTKPAPAPQSHGSGTGEAVVLNAIADDDYTLDRWSGDQALVDVLYPLA